MPVPVGFFEAIVRPSVVPDVRPNPSQQPPALSEEDRLVEIKSGNAKVSVFSHTRSSSWSKSQSSETNRRFDIAEISNAADPSQTLRAEVMTRVRLRDSNGNSMSRAYAPPEAGPSVRIVQRNVLRTRST